MALELTHTVCCIKKESAPCTCPSERALEFTCLTMKVTYTADAMSAQMDVCKTYSPVCLPSESIKRKTFNFSTWNFSRVDLM